MSSTEDYFAIDAVNWSSLKYLRESPLAYKYRLEVPREDTAALALGRLTHTLVFEPAKFAAEYAIWEGGRRAGKEWAEFQDAHAGMTIFKPEEIDVATAMADAVRRHPLVQPYLDGGKYEVPLLWTDEETGLRCKAKPDWLLKDKRTLIDLKTTRSIESHRFGNVAGKLGYHCQLAHYRNGVRGALGWLPKRVLIVAVEKDAPFDVGVFELDADTLYAGEEEVRELLNKLRAHRLTDQWPGRYVEEQALQLPAWMFADDDDADPESLGLAVGE